MVQFDELPVEIQEKMLEHQVAQGYPRNPDVFRKNISASGLRKGMYWCDTPEGKKFWKMVTDRDFDVFFQKYPKKEFTLPKNWHVVVTGENQKEVSEWRGYQGLIPIGKIAGICLKFNSSFHKGHNSQNDIKDKDGWYDFGQEITTEQFRKYVLKKEVEEDKRFPRMMLVWDGSNEKSAVKMEVHAYVPTTPKPWIASRTRHDHAKETPTPKFTYLTPQDISEGKGVGVDPKLIKFKE